MPFAALAQRQTPLVGFLNSASPDTYRFNADSFREGLAKAGFVEGRVIDVANIQSLASMPSKEELIAKVMFLINSGAQRLAVSLNGVARNMAVALNEAIKEGKFTEG